MGLAKALITTLFLIAFSAQTQAAYISELLPNPASDWNGNGANETYNDEWIELFFEVTDPTDGWSIGDPGKNYSFAAAAGYLVLYGSNSTIRLNNDADEIRLYRNNATVDTFTYSSSASERAWCKSPGQIAENCAPTPGYGTTTTITTSTTTTSTTTTSSSTTTTLSASSPSLSIVSKPSSMKFGDLSYVHVTFSPGTRSWSELRFFAYGYPSQVVADLSDNSMKASSYDADSVVRVSSVAGLAAVVVPLKIKNNCDKIYDDGDYRIRVRVAEPAWQELLTEDFTVSIAGNRCAADAITEPATKSSITIKITNVSSAYVGERFSVQGVVMTRGISAAGKIYSHVYNGSSLLTAGGWDANAEELVVGTDDASVFYLENSAEKPGNATLRVRFKVGDKDYDAVREVSVLERQQPAAKATITKNTTKTIQKQTPTGAFAAPGILSAITQFFGDLWSRIWSGFI